MPKSTEKLFCSDLILIEIDRISETTMAYHGRSRGLEILT